MKIVTDKKKIEELLTRGAAEIIERDSLRQKLLAGKQLRVKLGIDPTSPHLHLGRSIPLLKLRDFQELGHQVVFIVGDFTGVIGDTSDKDSERPMLAAEVVKKNLATYQEQAGKIIDLAKAEFRYNSEWLAKLSYGEIGRQADQFSLAEFIGRENIKRRLDAGTRVSLREILYPLMQGYDSVAVKADVELGGTDQRFNLLAGRTLQRHFKQEPQDILMNPLIEGLDGRKMSSSWGNTVNLDDAPEEMYGKVMTLADDLIIKYFINCTRAPLVKVVEMEQELASGVNPRDLKMRLAKTLVTMYHGAPAAKSAEAEFVKVFQKHEAPEEMPEVKLKKKKGKLVDILVEVGLAVSKGEARRLIEQGGVKVGEQVASDVNYELTVSAGGIVIQRGKRHFVRVK